MGRGGIALFGEPISKVFTEMNVEGELADVQYFERARFEHYPGRPCEVLLGKLGTEVHASGRVASPLPEGLRGDQVVLKTTGIRTPAKFFAYWEKHGGPSVFGYPLSPVLTDVASDDRYRAVQYFERARFEYYPEHAGTEFEVVARRIQGPVPVTGRVASPLPRGLQGEQIELRATGIRTPRAFYNFWDRHGGAGIFGYPLSPVLTVRGAGGRDIAVQYFERVRLEWHPDVTGKEQHVRLSDLGTQVFRRRYGSKQAGK